MPACILQATSSVRVMFTFSMKEVLLPISRNVYLSRQRYPNLDIMLPPSALTTHPTLILNSFESWSQRYLHPQNVGCATFLSQCKVMQWTPYPLRCDAAAATGDKMQPVRETRATNCQIKNELPQLSSLRCIKFRWLTWVWFHNGYICDFLMET